MSSHGQLTSCNSVMLSHVRHRSLASTSGCIASRTGRCGSSTRRATPSAVRTAPSRRHSSGRSSEWCSRCCATAASGAGAGGGSSGNGNGRGLGGSGSSDNNNSGSNHHKSGRAPSMFSLFLKAVASYVAVLWGWCLLIDLLPRPRLDTSNATVAVIIPALNEGSGLGATLEVLQALDPPVAEVIVADGGSTDNTVKVAKRGGAKVVKCSKRGRAAQMNAGADATASDLLCFLHADSVPPQDLVSVLRREFVDPRTVLLGFATSIEVPGRVLHWMTFNQFVKTYYSVIGMRPLSFARGMRLVFGDQTICCRASDFRRVGGYDERWPIMEDAELCLALHAAGPAPAAAPVPGRSAAASGERRSMLAPATGGAAGGQRYTNSSSSGLIGGAACGTRTMSADAAAAAAGHNPNYSRNSSSWLNNWLQPRGRVKQVVDRVNITSGRRLAAWGNLKGTWIHVVIGLTWYLQRENPDSPQKLLQLYKDMYTDTYR